MSPTELYQNVTLSRRANPIDTPVTIAPVVVTMQHTAAHPSRVSPELSPHVLRTSLLQTLDCPGHRAGGVRGRVTARRIKQYPISDGWPSQLILVIIIFNINVQIRPAIAQVDWFGTGKYRLSGSGSHAFNVQ